MLLKSKVLNFITPEDDKKSAALKAECERLEEELKQYTATASDLIDSYSKYSDDEIAAMHSKNKKEWDRYAAGWVKRYRDVERQMREHVKAMRERYYKSFNGDTDAILQDAREIINAITMQDYIDDYNAPETSKLREQHLESIKELSGEYYDFFRSLHEMGFMSCTVFIDQQLLDQKLALAYYGYGDGDNEPSRALVRLVETKAAEFFPAEPAKAPTKQEPRKRVKELRAMPIEVIDNHEAELLAEKAAVKDLLRIPTSPTTELIMRAFSAGRVVESSEIKERRELVAHRPGTIEVQDHNGKRRYISKSDAAEVEIRINDINALLKSKTAKKWLVLFLNKIAEQALNQDGTLKKGYIYIEPREVVADFKMYSTEWAAARAFLEVEPLFTNCTVRGYLKKGKKTIEQAESAVLFPFMKYKSREGFTVDINPRVNWSMVCSFFTLIHKAYFSLPNRAADLLYYIFYRARESTREIKEKGYFNISMRAVQERLGLPSEKNNREPQKTIKEPIEAAITAIEDAIRDADFTITPYYDMSAPIMAFLEKGYLQIAFKGHYAEYFTNLAKETNKKITAATTRTETAKERALEKYYLNKLEESAADQSGEQPKKRRGRPRKNQ